MGEIVKSAPREGSAKLPNLPPVTKRRKPLQIKSPSPSDNSETIRLERTQLSPRQDHPGGVRVPQAGPAGAGGQAESPCRLGDPSGKAVCLNRWTFPAHWSMVSVECAERFDSEKGGLYEPVQTRGRSPPCTAVSARMTAWTEIPTVSRTKSYYVEGGFSPPNTYDCGSFVVNGTAVVGKEKKSPYNHWKSTQKGADLYEINI